MGNLYLLRGNVVTGDGEYPGIGMGYTLVRLRRNSHFARISRTLA